MYGVVHGIAWARRNGAPPVAGLMPQTDLAILNWRREKSVFLGTNQPQEDASWIFQLRMAELERAKTGRTGEPLPFNRLAGRLFDYAIWGIVLALLLSELRGAKIVPDRLGFWLGHPLVAPMLITGTWIPMKALLMSSIGTTPGKWLFGCFLHSRFPTPMPAGKMQAQLRARAPTRVPRFWWEGVGCGFPLLAPVLIAVAYERLAQTQETAWDSAQDCLVTYAPPGMLNTVTGVTGLAAMLLALWSCFGVRPLADTVTMATTSIMRSLPSPSSLLPQDLLSGNAVSGIASGITRPAGTPAAPSGAPPAPPAAPGSSGAASPPMDAEVATLFAERRARIAALKVEGPRMLRTGNFRRAAELCSAWADLELANADAWRCLGQAEQAQGNHQEALNAFRKAKQLDPNDRVLDAEIERSQKGIVADFLNRYRR